MLVQNATILDKVVPLLVVILPIHGIVLRATMFTRSKRQSKWLLIVSLVALSCTGVFAWGSGLLKWWAMLTAALVLSNFNIRQLGLQLLLASMVSTGIVLWIASEGETLRRYPHSSMPYVGATVQLDETPRRYFFSAYDDTSLVSSTLTLGEGLAFVGDRAAITNSQIDITSESGSAAFVGDSNVLVNTTISCPATGSTANHRCLVLSPTTTLENVVVIHEGQASAPISGTGCSFEMMGADTIECGTIWNYTMPTYGHRTVLMRVKMLFPGTMRVVKLGAAFLGEWCTVLFAHGKVVFGVALQHSVWGLRSIVCGVYVGAVDKESSCFDNDEMYYPMYQGTMLTAELIASTGLPILVDTLGQALDAEYDVMLVMWQGMVDGASYAVQSPLWVIISTSVVLPLWSILMSLLADAFYAYIDVAFYILSVQQTLFFALCGQLGDLVGLVFYSLIDVLSVVWATIGVYSTTGIAVHVAIALVQSALLAAALWRDIKEEAARRQGFWLMSLPTIAMTTLMQRFKQIGYYAVAHLVAFLLVMGTNFFPSQLLHFLSLQCCFPFVSIYSLLQYFGREEERRTLAIGLIVRTIGAIVLQKCVGDVIAFALWEFAKIAIPMGMLYGALVAHKYWGSIKNMRGGGQQPANQTPTTS